MIILDNGNLIDLPPFNFLLDSQICSKVRPTIYHVVLSECRPNQVRGKSHIPKSDWLESAQTGTQERGSDGPL